MAGGKALDNSGGRPGSGSTAGAHAAAAAVRGGSLEDPMKELELDMLVDDGNIYAIFGEDV